MTFTVNDATACGGGERITIQITFEGGVTRNLRLTNDELFEEIDRDVARQRIITRLRSAAKEANATTLAQARTAIVGNTYKV